MPLSRQLRLHEIITHLFREIWDGLLSPNGLWRYNRVHQAFDSGHHGYTEQSSSLHDDDIIIEKFEA